MDNLALNSPITFGRGGNYLKYAVRGWSDPDSDARTWNNGHIAELDFKNGLLKRDPIFRIEATPFLAEPELRVQEIFIYLNGLWVHFAKVNNDLDAEIRVSRNYFNAQRNVLTFVMPLATCPHEEGWNEDRRILGFYFQRVELVDG